MTLTHIGLTPNTIYSSVFAQVNGIWVKVVKTTKDSVIVSDNVTSTKKVVPSMIKRVKAVIGDTVVYMK